ncbi:MAG TPA: hypothetical protein VF909_21495 [Roseiflexaceae bacterium]
MSRSVLPAAPIPPAARAPELMEVIATANPPRGHARGEAYA